MLVLTSWSTDHRSTKATASLSCSLVRIYRNYTGKGKGKGKEKKGKREGEVVIKTVTKVQDFFP